jgi:hypothetical protein
MGPDLPQLTNAPRAARFGARQHRRDKESPGRAGALGSNEETHLEGEL